MQGFIAQGGDFVTGTGAGGESVFGKKFKDDPAGLKLKHDRPGLLSTLRFLGCKHGLLFPRTDFVNTALEGSIWAVPLPIVCKYLPHFAALFKFYKICTRVHRSILRNSASIRENVCFS